MTQSFFTKHLGKLSILVLLIVALTCCAQAPINEQELITFCNSLEVGQSKNEVISQSKDLRGSRLIIDSDRDNSPMLISEGWMYATCHIDFKNGVLVNKQLGIS